MLDVRHLSRPGLGPVDLDVGAGECLVLRGPSGAGKTLLLRAIADLDPNDGAVTLNGRGRETFSAPEWRRRVVWVPPESGWWDPVVGAHFDGMATEILEAFGLDAGVLDWEVARLSTGERQRLALARALERDPSVLLLDEPTSGLDPDSVARVEAVLEGRTMVLVTHDPAQAERLADRVARIEAGRLVEED